MKKSKDSFSKQVIVILVIAGGIILWDSFSWSSGGMNGLLSMIVVFLTVFALIIVSAIALIKNLAQSGERKKNPKLQNSKYTSTSEAIETTSEPSTKAFLSSAKPNWKKRLPFVVPIMFVLASVLIVAIYSIYSSRQPYGEWERAPHPAGSKIKEVISSDARMVIVRTESGRTYIADPDFCEIAGTDRLDCWSANIKDFNFIEEDAVNDPPCPGEARLPEPPVQPASKESVYRNCGLGTTNEIRLFISEDGDLWYWNEFLITNSDIFIMAIYLSCLAIPISALLGAVSVWVYFKIQERKGARS